MDRRKFLINSTLTTSGLVISGSFPHLKAQRHQSDLAGKDELYQIFNNPDIKYRPFVRWWWLGNKIQKKEIARELRVLKAAGIGGVEINPIAFPGTNQYSRKTEDLGIPTIEWLSDEWLEMLDFAFKEAASLDMTCDLIVGTGFPFGAEFVEPEDRSQVVVIAVKKFEGPVNTEYSLFDLYKEADPRITNEYTGRTMEMLSVKLVPDPLTNMDEVIDLSDQIESGVIKVKTSKGNYALYALVRVDGFERVIVGAPGGMGPVVNHFDKKAVGNFLNTISDRVNEKIGGFPSNFRSFFVDSMELEGANWKSDMLEEFKKRRGYDIFPYLPFILFKIGRMGNNIDPEYIADIKPELDEKLARMRYDWALTNAEVFHENFIATYSKWCTDNNVKSRAQSYGRGYFLVEGSFDIDIPEAETWIKRTEQYEIGDDIPEAEFKKIPWDLGRGYTMINKYLSSGAHLKGKRLVSSEELTHTREVFNEAFEIFKIAGDKSTITGVTHPVFHGFNYSPLDVPFPGWIIWGGAFSERMSSWPYFKHYTDYRSRLSALLLQGDMYADIALLAPTSDMWAELGAQNEPFPTHVMPDYQPLVWESIHQNGGACDYVSERIIRDADIVNGSLKYGDRTYQSIFLIEVESIIPEAAEKLYHFVSQGGRVFCIEKEPNGAPGWKDHEQRDQKVQSWVEKMKKHPNNFILIRRPQENFCDWFGEVQKKYELSPSVRIKDPKTYITQVRYQMSDGEVFFFTNASNSHNYTLEATFPEHITKGKQAWLWDATNGERYKLRLNGNSLTLPLGYADSAIIVFNNDTEGAYWEPLPIEGGARAKVINGVWDVELQHYSGKLEFTKMDALKDLKDVPQYTHFAGTVKYSNTFQVKDKNDVNYLNLGDVHGISTVAVNGKDLGVQWFGNRVYPLKDHIQEGENTVEIWVVTEMANYLKSLKDNNVVQRWNRNPLKSLGLKGPVQVY